MPNWCQNEIKVFGEVDKMKPIVEAFRNAENDENILIMETLLGIEDRPANYDNGGWFDYNVEKFGTKWDFRGKDCGIIQLDDDIIWFNVDTAWSPPANFLDSLCKKYGVSATNVCLEPGCDFGGRSEFFPDKSPNEDYVSYHEAIFKYGVDFWDQIEYDAQEYLLDGGRDYDEFAKDFTFVPAEHQSKIRELYDKTYERLKDEL